MSRFFIIIIFVFSIYCDLCQDIEEFIIHILVQYRMASYVWRLAPFQDSYIIPILSIYSFLLAIRERSSNNDKKNEVILICYIAFYI